LTKLIKCVYEYFVFQGLHEDEKESLFLQQLRNSGREKRKMSKDKSLKAVKKLTASRNVLKRFERIDILRKQGKWKEGDKPFGLPKTKHG
jgi:small basic protein (TIGR04137 family)